MTDEDGKRTGEEPTLDEKVLPNGTIAQDTAVNGIRESLQERIARENPQGLTDFFAIIGDYLSPEARETRYTTVLIGFVKLRKMPGQNALYVDMAKAVIEDIFPGLEAIQKTPLEEQIIKFFTLVAEGKISPIDYDLRYFLGDQVGFEPEERTPLTAKELGRTAAVILPDNIYELAAIDEDICGISILRPNGKEEPIEWETIRKAGGWIIFKEDLGDLPTS